MLLRKPENGAGAGAGALSKTYKTLLRETNVGVLK